MTRAFVLAALAVVGSAATADESAARNAARIVVIEPHPGKAADFEAGYGRHLEWHRQAGDPWTWYAWQFVMGERIGQYMDGTFGHAWEDFDRAVDPAGDAADNQKNVRPYADFAYHGAWERLPAVSSAALPDDSRLLELTTYFVVPGRERTFEDLLEMAHEAMTAGEGEPPRYAWYRLVAGGSPPEYILMRPRNGLAALADGGSFFTDALDRQVQHLQAPFGIALAGTLREVRSELLRFRVDLTYVPQ